MLSRTSLISLAGFFAISHAAPATRATSITIDCTNIFFQFNWLVGDCLTGKGSERIQSAVYLPNKISNRNGNLAWEVEGGFVQTCNDCLLIPPTTLNCQCLPSVGRTRVDTILDLSERIKNYNGHLLSDVAGPPIVPATSSSIKFPTDPSWKLVEAKQTCWSTSPANTTLYCTSLPPRHTDGCPGFWEGTSADGTPNKCFSYRIPVSIPVWYQYESLKTDAPGRAYRFEAYEDVDCTSKPVGTIGPEENGVCKDFGTKALGIKVVPLWNANV